jgi:hypothetical protein
MSTIVEEASYTSTSLSRLVLLIAVPAIALSLMAALTLRQDARSERASVTGAQATVSVTRALPSPRDDGDFTLYILSSAQDAQRLTGLGGRDWYAYVSTPGEEAELMRAWDHADWIRNESGLPPIRVVDLRQSSRVTSAHGALGMEDR